VHARSDLAFLRYAVLVFPVMLMENFHHTASLILKPTLEKQITLASILEGFEEKELLMMSRDKTSAGQAVSGAYQVVVVL